MTADQAFNCIKREGGWHLDSDDFVAPNLNDEKKTMQKNTNFKNEKRKREIQWTTYYKLSPHKNNLRRFTMAPLSFQASQKQPKPIWPIYPSLNSQLPPSYLFPHSIYFIFFSLF